MSIRQLTEKDYISYKTLINDFRETEFTEKQFIDMIQHMKPFTEIWVIENDGELTLSPNNNSSICGPGEPPKGAERGHSIDGLINRGMSSDFSRQTPPFGPEGGVCSGKELIATGTILFERKFIYNLCMLCHIEDVCVKKEFRSHGFGKQIISHLISRSKEKDAYKITLDCNEMNVEFYKKCGLEQRGVQMSQLNSFPEQTRPFGT